MFERSNLVPLNVLLRWWRGLWWLPLTTNEKALFGRIPGFRAVDEHATSYDRRIG